MKVTVKVNRKGNLDGLMNRIIEGVEVGMAIGGEQMRMAVEATANDMARYPTGELEGSMTYDPISFGVVSEARVIAGTDHADPFHFGATEHFVPYEEADERIKAGLYPHCRPVYEGDDKTPRAYMPKTFYRSDSVMPTNRKIIGYMVSSAAHPFMKEGFDAARNMFVQEVTNQVAAAVER